MNSRFFVSCPYESGPPRIVYTRQVEFEFQQLSQQHPSEDSPRGSAGQRGLLKPSRGLRWLRLREIECKVILGFLPQELVDQHVDHHQSDQAHSCSNGNQEEDRHHLQAKWRGKTLKGTWGYLHGQTHLSTEGVDKKFMFGYDIFLFATQGFRASELCPREARRPQPRTSWKASISPCEARNLGVRLQSKRSIRETQESK